MSSSSPPPPSSSSSSMSFPIVVIAIVGILGTAAFLVIYYVFVIKCCLNIRISEPDHILRRLSRSRRRLRRHFSFTSAAAPIERRHGLDPSAIRAIPTFRYSSSPAAAAAAATPTIECAVCLLEFREDERLRRLPGCAHAFHIDCIDTWLESSASCPLCRAEVTKPSTEESVVIEMGEKWVGKVGSMGDECVEVRREKDERFVVQPMRRSLSMDSSGDRKLLEAVQEALRRNPELLFREEGSSSGGGGRRGQKLLIAFGGWRSGRSSRRAVQPVEMEV